MKDKKLVSKLFCSCASFFRSTPKKLNVFKNFLNACVKEYDWKAVL